MSYRLCQYIACEPSIGIHKNNCISMAEEMRRRSRTDLVLWQWRRLVFLSIFLFSMNNFHKMLLESGKTPSALDTEAFNCTCYGIDTTLNPRDNPKVSLQMTSQTTIYLHKFLTLTADSDESFCTICLRRWIFDRPNQTNLFSQQIFQRVCMSSFLSCSLERGKLCIKIIICLVNEEEDAQIRGEEDDQIHVINLFLLSSQRRLIRFVMAVLVSM